MKKRPKQSSRRHDLQTKRQQAKEALKESAEKHRLVLENVDEIVYMVETTGDDPFRGKVQFVSSRVESIIGYKPEEFLDDPGLWSRLLHPDDESTVEAQTKAIFASGWGGLREYRVRHKTTGEYRWMEDRVILRLDDSGQVIGFFGVARDSTERRQADERLRFLNEALFQARCAVIVVDIEGRITYWNRSAEQLYGFRAEEVHGRTIEDVLQPRWLRGATAEAVSRALATTSSWCGENIHVKKSGEEIYVESALTLLRDEKGTVVGTLIIIRDISGRKQMEEQLQDYTQRLQTLSHQLLQVQERERRAMARELHDEIGQVLTGFKLALETSLDLPADVTRSRISEALTLVNELIGRVRELALNLRPAILDDLGLVPALEWHCERFTAQTQMKVNFTHTGVARRFPPEVETAAYRIVQEALTNVALHAGVDEATVSLRSDQDQLIVEIYDRGTGFDPDTVLAAGVGSGLAGMRERAVLLGGQLTVESAPGRGTRVTVYLPMAEE
jgi:PAS domain S-box-containing protein